MISLLTRLDPSMLELPTLHIDTINMVLLQFSRRTSEIRKSQIDNYSKTPKLTRSMF